MRRGLSVRLGLVLIVAGAWGGATPAAETYRFAWYQGGTPLGATATFNRDPSSTTVVTLQLYFLQDAAGQSPRSDTLNSPGLFGYGFQLNAGSNGGPLQVATTAALKSNNTVFDDADSKTLTANTATIVDKVSNASPAATSASGVRAIRLADIDFTLPSDGVFTLTASPTPAGMVDFDGNDLNDTLSGYTTFNGSLSVLVTSVPEPAALLALAAAGLLATRRHRRTAAATAASPASSAAPLRA